MNTLDLLVPISPENWRSRVTELDSADMLKHYGYELTDFAPCYLDGPTAADFGVRENGSLKAKSMDDAVLRAGQEALEGFLKLAAENRCALAYCLKRKMDLNVMSTGSIGCYIQYTAQGLVPKNRGDSQ